MAFSPGIGRSIGRAVDRAREQSRGAQSDRGGTFFDRQRQRAQGADLSGFRPSANPEVAASGEVHQRAAERIEAVHAPAVTGALAAALRGDEETAADLLARDIAAETLGIGRRLASEEVVDPETGEKTRVAGFVNTINPVSLVGMVPFGVGVAGAVALGKAIGPFAGLQAGLDALNQRQALQAIGPTFEVGGFQPTRGTIARAQARRAAGKAPTAADLLAFDYQERRKASVDASRRQREQRDDPERDLARSVVVPMAPAAPGAAEPSRPSSFGRIAGRDPRAEVDLLRTGDQAAVAAGVAAPKPRLTGGRLPPRPGALF